MPYNLNKQFPTVVPIHLHQNKMFNTLTLALPPRVGFLLFGWIKNTSHIFEHLVPPKNTNYINTIYSHYRNNQKSNPNRNTSGKSVSFLTISEFFHLTAYSNWRLGNGCDGPQFKSRNGQEIIFFSKSSGVHSTTHSMGTAVLSRGLSGQSVKLTITSHYHRG